ncbi:MAG TPA: iron-sulfur cluster assembly scaffold protein [Thermoanaerobaculia bacterium]
MTPYGEIVHDHSRNPRNWGSIDAPDFRCEGHNPFCGDRVRVELTVSPGHAIAAARFQGDLCVIAKAATSLLTERLVGLPLQSTAEIDEDEFIASLQFPIPQPRRSCALLALRVVQASTEAPHV